MKNSEQQAFPSTRKYNDGNTEIINIQFGLTKREYACIMLGVPETEDEDLNSIIRKSERKKMAGLVLQGLIAREGIFLDEKIGTEKAIEVADEFLKQLGDND